MQTRVYVDGFNLYYGALKGTPYKWLNPVELSKFFLPQGYTVDKVLYFTARVSGAVDPAFWQLSCQNSLAAPYQFTRRK